eukprot:6257622-Prymnesium_polylepis.1
MREPLECSHAPRHADPDTDHTRAAAPVRSDALAHCSALLADSAPQPLEYGGQPRQLHACRDLDAMLFC